MNTTKAPANHSTRTNLLIDATIFVAVLIAFQPQLTGLALHEWLSLAFGGGILTHLVLHWRWVVNVVKRFIPKLPLQTRLNAVLNLALLAATAGVMVSGIMMSEVALPALGITLAAGHSWHAIHSIAANAIVALSMLHVAVHWKWIANAISRYVVRPITGWFAQPAAEPADALAAPARKTGTGFAGWALGLASLAWLVGLFGGWFVGAIQDTDDTAASASTTISSNSSTTTNVQSFTPRTRSSQ